MLTPRHISWCFVAAFATVIPGACALNPDQLGPAGYVRTTFTIEDGLPDNVVNAVVQSQNGYLWVGTQGGLARFDGQHFTLVRLRGEHSREVSVNALVSGANGDLWVGTDSGLAHVPKTAVDHFDSTLVKLYHPGAGLGDQIICLLLGGEGSLWVGTSHGLYRVDHDKVVTVMPDEWVSRIEKAPNGDLLIITSEGYVSHHLRMANSSETNSLGSRFAERVGSRLIPHPEISRQLGVKENQIFQVSEFHTGETWFCTPAGVARRVNGSFHRLSPYGTSLQNPAYRVYEDIQGNVWAVTQKGLFRKRTIP